MIYIYDIIINWTFYTAMSVAGYKLHIGTYAILIT